VLVKMQELYHFKKNNKMNSIQKEEYDKLRIEESNFYNAYNEYIEFLLAEGSYKM
jgi:hypothetical protein